MIEVLAAVDVGVESSGHVRAIAPARGVVVDVADNCLSSARCDAGR